MFDQYSSSATLSRASRICSKGRSTNLSGGLFFRDRVHDTGWKPVSSRGMETSPTTSGLRQHVRCSVRDARDEGREVIVARVGLPASQIDGRDWHWQSSILGMISVACLSCIERGYGPESAGEFSTREAALWLREQMFFSTGLML